MSALPNLFAKAAIQLPTPKRTHTPARRHGRSEWTRHSLPPPLPPTSPGTKVGVETPEIQSPDFSVSAIALSRSAATLARIVSDIAPSL